ncbi:MAG TPA: hypothetical protein VMG82_40255 [Candidatus Sulfotelmatobacter sp.]|nr:hypothetical protein [Candidatus Sulfotelmatobacter sp.]
MRALRLIAIILLFISSSSASDLANSFAQAVALADGQERAPQTKGYSSKVLLSYYTQKYGPVLKSCFASVKQPGNGSFDFVAAIGPDGKLLRLYEEGKTNISECLLTRVKDDTFPAPPESPFYFHVEMKFSDDPPARADSSPEAPPLVVKPNRYSYTFGVPTGWEFNFEQAHQRGAALAYFPKGGDFNDSSAVMYVNEIDSACPDDCMSPVSQAIDETLRDVKSENSSVKIGAGEPVLTKDGIKAAVRLLKEGIDPRDPRLRDHEALAFIGDHETIILVVLSSRDAHTWEQDYSAFRQVVAGHKFFSCNSPGLAVPCHK